jgi:hypothetical protein
MENVFSDLPDELRGDRGHFIIMISVTSLLAFLR